MWTLFLSPDGEYIFTSSPKKEEITYLPGDILIFNKDGKQVHKFKSQSQGYQLEFLSNVKALVRFTVEKGNTPFSGILEKNNKDKWSLIIEETEPDTKTSPFGAGINDAKLNNFELERTDKKKYTLSSKTESIELKLQAAIYEAKETVDGKLALRIGTRLIQLFDKKLEKILEIKETENVQSITLSDNCIVILTKKEIRGYSITGALLWRYSSIPKTNIVEGYWYSQEKKIVWIVSSNIESVIATLSEDGGILNSQSFDKQLYHRPLVCFPIQSCFVAQTNEKIESFKI